MAGARREPSENDGTNETHASWLTRDIPPQPTAVASPSSDPGFAGGRDVIAFAAGLVHPLADACAVVILDGGGTLAHSLAFHRDPAAAPLVRTAGEALALSPLSSLRRLVAAGRPFMLHDEGELAADEALRAALDPLAARSIACIPLQRRVRGLVVLASATPHRWSAQDVASLRAIGGAIVALLAGDDVRTEAEELVADIHHDVGNSLHAISLSLEFLLSLSPENDRRANRHAFVQLRQTARRMTQLLAEVDEYLYGRAHPEATTTTTVAAAIDEVVATLTPIAVERSIRLVAERTDPTSCAHIPPRELFRVISNLVSNAIKYTHAHTVVRIATRTSADRVQIVVEDEGPGIASDDCAHLFDREWLARSALRKGKGLGLAIARRLVEAHGGTIAVSSELGRGTRFVVELRRVSLTPP